ncbi:hypothetical protein B0J18DRAFT_414926 [Chaetomium sp. MPI-SDFR-AT-0129]|nr:hypothetical protein B0J18DRAFT_414926 [Chaetomium sp. MPI-SDFR-AT-0129]
MLVPWAVVVVAATAVSATSTAWSSLPIDLKDKARTRTSRDVDSSALPDFDVLDNLFAALSDMQTTYFQNWIGTWPDAIDWTRAVMSTHVSAALRTISDEFELSQPGGGVVGCVLGKEEVVSGYFADIIGYYFAEDAFALRNQAYDDMLWVVLGWLEAIQFVDEHNDFFSNSASTAGLPSMPGAEAWYGNRWVPAFAHRARIFWELASKGWDTKLCGGGMVWNPRLTPYKNAVTNELYIAASIGMYLYFPGDSNTSPYVSSATSESAPCSPSPSPSPSPAGDPNSTNSQGWPARDPRFIVAAQEAHDWLTTSNMTNSAGLYADGFHISGYTSGGNNTRCDERDEMVYTYNQGVLLSGLLGLYQAALRDGGSGETYLREGHTLIQNVIRATGFDLEHNRPIDPIVPNRVPPWRGLGRVGVLEEACDATGECSQDGQTFKGIWMHHFGTFCSPRALGSKSGSGFGSTSEAVRTQHEAECRRYIPWLRHNARAALGTKDDRGLFGMWWTAGLLGLRSTDAVDQAGDAEPFPTSDDGNMVDYRNRGVPHNDIWMGVVDAISNILPREASAKHGPARAQQKPLKVAGGGSGPNGSPSTTTSTRTESRSEPWGSRSQTQSSPWDPNLRGRGRTVETQGGGLAVLRALWVVSRLEV